MASEFQLQLLRGAARRSLASGFALALAVVCVLLLASAPQASAGAVKVEVRDGAGAAVHEAVVYAVSLAGGGKAGEPAQAVVDQVDKEFVGRVTVVRKGTAVSFPNHDNIRHHVYSFSPAKTFEIPLYTGTPRDRIVFDTPGEVSLGCNIHDWMSGYVYVVDTPYFGVTGENGAASLDLPSGDYELFVWHPRLIGPAKKTGRKISAAGDGDTVSFTIDLRKAIKPRRGPTASRAGGGGYR